MTDYSIDNALATAKNCITIELMNKSTQTSVPQVSVDGNNTMRQLLDEYALDVGINPNAAKIVFDNKRTGDSTSDLNETVTGLGLQDGDVLLVTDDGCVA